MSDWEKVREIASIHSEWVDIFCEEWRDTRSVNLEYWRVEKQDSIIVIPLYKDSLFFPEKQFRPGINRRTLDFPGGRLNGENKERAAYEVLSRELGVGRGQVSKLDELTRSPQVINSSFSNQSLHVFLAVLSKAPVLRNTSYKTSKIDKLFAELDCLQCSYALMLFSEFID